MFLKQLEGGKRGRRSGRITWGLALLVLNVDKEGNVSGQLGEMESLKGGNDLLGEALLGKVFRKETTHHGIRRM